MMRTCLASMCTRMQHIYDDRRYGSLHYRLVSLSPLHHHYTVLSQQNAGWRVLGLLGGKYHSAQQMRTRQMLPRVS